MRRSLARALFVLAMLGTIAPAQTPKQPKVAPGPGEPDWDVLLKQRYGLSMFGDLLNPVKTTVEATPGLFRKAGSGPVAYTPLIALGLETTNRGGWYTTDAGGKDPVKHEVWSYTFK